MEYDNEINIDYKEAYNELKRHILPCCDILDCSNEYLFASIKDLYSRKLQLEGKVEALTEVIKRNY